MGRGIVTLGAALLCAALLAGAGGCSSVEVVRLRSKLLETPPLKRPLAGVQVSCVGFYLFTLGIPSCDLERVVNELLLPKARAMGATKIVELRFEQTPESGVWWLTKLFWFRSARVSAVVLEDEAPPRPAPRSTHPPPPSSTPMSTPSSTPAPTSAPGGTP